MDDCWDWVVIGEALGWIVIHGLNLDLQKMLAKQDRIDWRTVPVMINHTYIHASVSQSLINVNPP